MNSQDTSNNTTAPKSGKWSRKKLVTIFGAASLLAVGAFATVAQSGGGYFGHHMGGHGMGGHSMGMGGFMHGSYDPVKFEKHLDRKLQIFGIAFDASDEQQADLKKIITSLVAEVHPMKAKLRETREQLHDLLIQPKIDRAAIEALRVEKLALVDDLSKKVTAALADAGETLNLEQRIKLGKLMSKFGEHRRSWHKG